MAWKSQRLMKGSEDMTKAWWIRTCTYAGLAEDAPTPTWRSFLVRDAFILSTRASIFRARNPQERTNHRYNVSRYHRATAYDGNWRLKPFMQSHSP
ncbi:predicted protein [Lichtheimia corymbifera JMRC:FSU:9682]|nr:predicted protein [Lichtheimia corymbifera JMRC:FSU:9682]